MKIEKDSKMNILIYGAGRLGKQLLPFIESYLGDSVNILGFIDDTMLKGENVSGPYQTVGSLDQIIASGEYCPDKVNLVFAIGYSNMEERFVAFNKVRNMGYEFFSLIHPRSVVEKDVKLGQGTIISAGAVIDKGTQIGDGNYIDIGVVIGEENVIGDNNFICAGSVTGGFVKIGNGNFIGLNSTIVNDLEIGNNNFINAMTLVHKNISDNTRVVEFHEQHILS